MDLIEIVLRAVSPVVSLVAIGVSVAVYRAGARRKELDLLKTDIEAVADKAEGAVKTVAQDLASHKEAGQDSRIELRERLIMVEQHLAQMPDRDLVHKLALDVTEIRGSINTQGEALKGVAATGRRVEEYLLQRGGA